MQKVKILGIAPYEGNQCAQVGFHAFATASHEI